MFILTYARVHEEHILGYLDGVLVGELVRNSGKGWQVWYGNTHVENVWIEDLRDAKQFLENKVKINYEFRKDN